MHHGALLQGADQQGMVYVLLCFLSTVKIAVLHWSPTSILTPAACSPPLRPQTFHL